MEHHISVSRTARYYVLGELAGATDVWIACHGYAQLARYFVRPFAAIVESGRAVVAPEALNRYYSESAPGVHGPDARVAATWMTREDRDAEIADYVAYLDALVDVVRGAAPAARVTALGFSQGAQTVSRWAVRGNAKLDRVILWGSGVAHDVALQEGSMRGTGVVLAAGEQDRHYDPSRAEMDRARLAAVGIGARVFRHGGGHRITAESLTSLLGFLQ